MIKIKKNEYFDVFSANSYLLIDQSRNAVLIDCGYYDKNIVDYIKNNNLNFKAILLTHAHFDHIAGLNKMLNDFNVPVYIFNDDVKLLSNSSLNGSFLIGEEINVDVKNIKIIADNDIINLLEEPIKVIHTPYHTQGSVVFYLKESKCLFTGDSLFDGSIGRYDLPTSNFRLIKSSLEKIFSLPEETIVYPGHGPNTTLKNKLYL